MHVIYTFIHKALCTSSINLTWLLLSAWMNLLRFVIDIDGVDCHSEIKIYRALRIIKNLYLLKSEKSMLHICQFMRNLFHVKTKIILSNRFYIMVFDMKHEINILWWSDITFDLFRENPSKQIINPLYSKFKEKIGQQKISFHQFLTLK